MFPEPFFRDATSLCGADGDRASAAAGKHGTGVADEPSGGGGEGESSWLVGAAASGRAAASAANALLRPWGGKRPRRFGGGEGGKDGEHPLGAVVTGAADCGLVGLAHGPKHVELVAAVGAAVFVKGHDGRILVSGSRFCQGDDLCCHTQPTPLPTATPRTPRLLVSRKTHMPRTPPPPRPSDATSQPPTSA